MIRIVYRTCGWNNHNNRPDWFHYRSCWENLVNTTKDSDCAITVLYDGELQGHEVYELIRDNINDWDDNDIIYLVEDDYMHFPGWTTVLQNVYDMYDSINYVSLYDHPDKYTPRYQGLQSQIIVSNYCHWRTVPSSCGTFAGRVKTFKEDLDIHMGSLGDHNKFTLLAERNRNIISAMPAFATHCVNPWTSTFRDWANV